MTLTLMDYNEEKTETEIGSLDDIEKIYITVVSGDEIADITYKDGLKIKIDAGLNTRIEDYYDYSYTLYGKGVNHFERFCVRRDTYDMGAIY